MKSNGNNSINDGSDDIGQAGEVNPLVDGDDFNAHRVVESPEGSLIIHQSGPGVPIAAIVLIDADEQVTYLASPEFRGPRATEIIACGLTNIANRVHEHAKTLARQEIEPFAPSVDLSAEQSALLDELSAMFDAAFKGGDDASGSAS